MQYAPQVEHEETETNKPELNPPYTRLCKEEIKTTSKLFGDDLSKNLKDMAELKKSGDTDANTLKYKHIIPGLQGS